MDPALDECQQQVGPAQQTLLLALRRDGPLSAEELAARLAMSRTATLQQLRSLADMGLVERRAVRHGVGRPRHLYDVTPAAQRLLPAAYDALALALVAAAREIGGQELLSQLLDVRRREQTAAIRARFRARGLDSATLGERARELAAIQDESGYVCDVVEDDAIRLREHNCPVLQVAVVSSAICKAELRLIVETLEADVERETHIVAGGRSCTYRIAPRRWDINQPRVWDSKQMRFAPRQG